MLKVNEKKIKMYYIGVQNFQDFQKLNIHKKFVDIPLHIVYAVCCILALPTGNARFGFFQAFSHLKNSISIS